jgi:hypothetical protein
MLICCGLADEPRLPMVMYCCRLGTQMRLLWLAGVVKPAMLVEVVVI